MYWSLCDYDLKKFIGSKPNQGGANYPVNSFLTTSHGLCDSETCADFRNFTYMKSIRFTTKEESKREQEQAFLALSGVEHLAWFFANAGPKSSFATVTDADSENDDFVLYHKDYGAPLG